MPEHIILGKLIGRVGQGKTRPQFVSAARAGESVGCGTLELLALATKAKTQVVMVELSGGVHRALIFPADTIPALRKAKAAKRKRK